MIKAKKFMRKEVVFLTALFIAFISIVFVPIDQEYINYFDIKTLLFLFVIMLILAGFTKIHVFEYISYHLIEKLNTTRKLITVLIFITFFASMFIANDMALLTFLPLSLITLKAANKEEHLIFTIIMQNIAANLGGMLTPFGNPENLYLYSYYTIGSIEFMAIMIKPFLVAIIMIGIVCFLIPKTHVELINFEKPTLNKQKTYILIILSILIILAIFRLINYLFIAGAIFAYFILFDRKAFLKIDYFLIFTFVCFFIFAGNFARISVVNQFASNLLTINTYLTTIVSCQIISNVPTAVFLSKFTSNYKDLLLAVNVGSVGTLISSLASLISFRIYTKKYNNSAKKYLVNFTVLNLIFLVTLATITYYIK